MEREIVLEGPLDQAQKNRLLEIAERCPVHRTFEGEVKVVTRLKAP
jgi:putative redox protein